MSVLELSAVLAIAFVIAAPALIQLPGKPLPNGGRAARRYFLRFAAAAALSGVVAGITSALVPDQPMPIIIGAANAALVGGPAYFWAGMRQLRDTSITPGWVVSVAVAATFIASATVTAVIGGPTDGFVLRLILVAVGCGGVAIEAFRPPARDIAAFRLIGVIFAVYAVYSAIRTFMFFAVGEDSPAFQTVFSPLTASVLSILLVVTLCVAVWWSDRALETRARQIEYLINALRSDIASHGAVTVYDVEVPDLSLIRAAFGGPAATAVDRAAAMSLHELLPDAAHRGRVGRHVVALPGDQRIENLERVVKAATAHAVPNLDYREAIEIRITRYTLHSEAELAAVWPDAAPTATSDLKTRPAGGVVS